MLHHHTTEDRSILPKPLALTPNEVQQVAAGTAASLPEQIKIGATWGLWPPPGPIEALPSLAKN
jgi:hypothetical protein